MNVRSIGLGLLGLLVAPSLSAAVLTFNGTLFSPNEGQGSSIDRIAFRVTSPGTILLDVLAWELDSYNGGNGVDLNGDGEFTFFDSVIQVYRDDGDLTSDDFIDANDDPGFFGNQGRGDGSTTDRDSVLEVNLAAGDYLVAIGPWNQGGGFSFAQVLAGGFQESTVLTRLLEGNLPAAHDYSDYRLTITGNVAAVPLPGAAFLLPPALGVFGLGLRRRS